MPRGSVGALLLQQNWLPVVRVPSTTVGGAARSRSRSRSRVLDRDPFLASGGSGDDLDPALSRDGLRHLHRDPIRASGDDLHCDPALELTSGDDLHRDPVIVSVDGGGSEHILASGDDSDDDDFVAWSWFYAQDADRDRVVVGSGDNLPIGCYVKWLCSDLPCNEKQEFGFFM